MKKHLIAGAMMSVILSGSVMAADTGTAQDTATWVVTAQKDSHARLIVSPVGSINFKYLPKSKTFAPTDAPFIVNIQNDSSAGTDATDFKLEAIQTEGYAAHIAQPDQKFEVLLSVGDEALSKLKATPTLLNKSGSINSFLTSLDGLAAASESADRFVATAVAPTGSSFDKLPDGMYEGQAQVTFQATWS
ncbi:MAG: common pilus major fimbrillin subunit EcpA [Plesiomonas sp.]|uniref:common pilus major fimbrillin subunit EcpA n=1 Tax=Plesiomonas sp. TaxID=2486279 RepID=UPI003EE57EFC